MIKFFINGSLKESTLLLLKIAFFSINVVTVRETTYCGLETIEICCTRELAVHFIKDATKNF